MRKKYKVKVEFDIELNKDFKDNHIGMNIKNAICCAVDEGLEKSGVNFSNVQCKDIEFSHLI